jgi:hypothetical protein
MLGAMNFFPEGCSRKDRKERQAKQQSAEREALNAKYVFLCGLGALGAESEIADYVGKNQ